MTRSIILCPVKVDNKTYLQYILFANSRPTFKSYSMKWCLKNLTCCKNKVIATTLETFR